MLARPSTLAAAHTRAVRLAVAVARQGMIDKTLLFDIELLRIDSK